MKRAADPRLRLIQGKHNPLVKELRAAFARGELSSSGACAIEGLRIVEEAIRSGLRLEALFFSESAQNIAERLLPQTGAHVQTLLLPDKLFAAVVPSESPQGVAALVRMKEHSLDDLIRRSYAGIVVAVAGIQDPGNLGTIIRSGEAFGAAGILIGENSVSPFNSKVIRAAAGSLFRVPFARSQLRDTLAQLKAANFRVLATSSHKGASVTQADFSGAVAVLIGSEGSGLSRDLLAAADQVLVIPHAPQIESLNAGVAASIVLYEAAKQRGQSI